VLEPIGVLAISAIDRTARRLNIGGLPRLLAQRAQDRRRMQRTGANLDILRLENRAALFGPVAVKGQDQVLKRQRFFGGVSHNQSAIALNFAANIEGGPLSGKPKDPVI
jgi:hypothetical protein